MEVSNDLSKGIEQIASTRDFAATVAHLESVLTAKGLTIFAKIDFSGDAERAGLKMPPTQALIFGNPKAGTPVMLAAPGSALDLPLKIVVSEDAKGKIWLSYNSPEYLAGRHEIPAELLKNIAGIRALASAAAA
jgi:uncharacterized protein (DUF302 family)